MTAHERDATRDAWQCAADACLEHDPDHERRACAELRQLGELVVPDQRPATDQQQATAP